MATTQSSCSTPDIALGLTTFLKAFRVAVAPAALTYDEWKTAKLTASNDFLDGLLDVLKVTNFIYFNVEGITDVPLAVQRGQKPFNTAWIDPPVQPSNYTNVELFQLSIKSAFGIPPISQSAALFVMRIKWYDGATPVATPANFDTLWSQ